MKLLVSPFTHPLDNLIIEEVLLRHTDDSWLFFYYNLPAVLIGRHQNPLAEVNIRFVQEQQIPWLRRLSGGGAVYHDPFNANICFVLPLERKYYNRYTPFLTPLVEFLKQFHLPVTVNDRNDLMLYGKKISGNAQFTTERRMLSHGTLLYATDLAILRESLRPTASLSASKAVPSRRSSVTTVAAHLAAPPAWDEFYQALIAFFQRHFAAEPSELPESYWAQREKLKAKFTADEWLYARTPDFILQYRDTTGNLYEITFHRGKAISSTPPMALPLPTLKTLAPTVLQSEQ